ncbi:MAG TPA: M20 family metallopeptidase [Ktedonobacteraceae bacterium]|nr:M20 family metallopeptidase [Ktedonobacteraceae bacterium]
MSQLSSLEQAEQILPAFLEDLQSIVNIDSGTYTPEGVNKVGAYLAGRFQGWGFTPHFEQQQEYGNHLLATRQGQNTQGPRLLCIGHIDTVFPAGEAARRPFTIHERDGRRVATGPGVLDMKSGVLIGMYALYLLAQAGEESYQNVTFLCNSDEEIGSPSSKPLIRELAAQHDAVLVFEPGRKEHTVVSARKGCGRYKIEVWGRAAHAGVEPHLGRNAILELASQVQKLQALNGTIPGVTVNVGIIHGGERTNIVPDYAYCELDIRSSDQAGIRAVEAAMRNISTQHVVDGTRIKLSGSMGSQPFERNSQNGPLIEHIKAAGAELGLEIQDVGSGGASDANTSSWAGTPTLDGLGAGGGLAHNPDEYIELDYLPKRIALVMGLIKRLGSV